MAHLPLRISGKLDRPKTLRWFVAASFIGSFAIAGAVMLATLACPQEWGWVGSGNVEASNLEVGLCELRQSCKPGKGAIFAYVLCVLAFTVYQYHRGVQLRRSLEVQHATAVLKRHFTLSQFYVFTVFVIFAFVALHDLAHLAGARSQWLNALITEIFTCWPGHHLPRALAHSF